MGWVVGLLLSSLKVQLQVDLMKLTFSWWRMVWFEKDVGQGGAGKDVDTPSS